MARPAGPGAPLSAAVAAAASMPVARPRDGLTLHTLRDGVRLARRRVATAGPGLIRLYLDRRPEPEWRGPPAGTYCNLSPGSDDSNTRSVSPKQGGPLSTPTRPAGGCRARRSLAARPLIRAGGWQRRLRREQ